MGGSCALWKIMFCERSEFLQVQQEGRNLLHNLALQLGGNMSLSLHPLHSVYVGGSCVCVLCAKTLPFLLAHILEV